ncbi:hypothetical protein EYV94_08065 [Puteibacter caeruleilacunae]|nr:hypothetical protein EYV94_08065 [Puteibacter caeruleilacunae]
MGKLNNKGEFSGRVGDMIGVINKYGKHYIRRKPEEYHDANSAKQQKQRTRFAAINKFISRINPIIIRPIWHGYSKKMQGTALFSKTNFQVWDNNGYIAHYDQLKMTVGRLRVPFGLRAKRVEGEDRTIEIAWKPSINPAKNCVEGKYINFVALCDGDIYHMTEYPLEQDNYNVEFQLDFPKGSAVHLYVYFSRQKGRENMKYSESTYCYIDSL